MGDDGKLYVPDTFLPVYRSVIASADLVTPNGFEAGLLAEMPVTTHDQVREALVKIRALGPKIVVITSVVLDGGLLYLYAAMQGSSFRVSIPMLDYSFTGTGDLFAALLVGHLPALVTPEGLQQACLTALGKMHAVLNRTFASGHRELQLVASIADLQSDGGDRDGLFTLEVL